MLNQGFEGPDPVESNQAEWYGDSVVVHVLDKACGAVGYANQHPEQGEFVGGGLAVVDDDVPEQRQCAHTVVRCLKANRLPGYAFAAKPVVRLGDPSDSEPVTARELFDLVHMCGVHLPTIRWLSLAQRHHDPAAGT